MAMELSVIVVSWNAEQELGRCLVSLPEATQGLETEILLVDNASSDGTVAMVRYYFKNVKIIENSSNLGFGAGAQTGLSHATGRFIAVLNPDLVLAPGSLAGLVRFLYQHPLAGWVGPKIRLETGRVQSEARALPGMWSALSLLPVLGRLRPAHARRQPSSITRCGWVRGPCMVFRARALRKIGGLPTGTFMYGEEIVLGHRLQKAGWETWYNPCFEVLHKHQASARRRWSEREIHIAVWTGRAVAMLEVLGRLRFTAWGSLVVTALALRAMLQTFGLRPASIPTWPVFRIYVRALLTGRIPSSSEVHGRPESDSVVARGFKSRNHTRP